MESEVESLEGLADSHRKDLAALEEEIKLNKTRIQLPKERAAIAASVAMDIGAATGSSGPKHPPRLRLTHLAGRQAEVALQILGRRTKTPSPRTLVTQNTLLSPRLWRECRLLFLWVAPHIGISNGRRLTPHSTSPPSPVMPMRGLAEYAQVSPHVSG